MQEELKEVDLHSIMYLLIQKHEIITIYPNLLFTFHNVSINSLIAEAVLIVLIIFTFHNVSINSSTDKDLVSK